jgi:hypothetical protein
MGVDNRASAHGVCAIIRGMDHSDVSRMGANALNKKLTAKQRSRNARKAARARWKRVRS